MPFAVELYGRLGASSKSFLQALGNVALAHSFVLRAYREVSCALQRSPGLMNGRSFNMALASVRQFMPGRIACVLEEGFLQRNEQRSQ
jgi:hypothetical protein